MIDFITIFVNHYFITHLLKGKKKRRKQEHYKENKNTASNFSNEDSSYYSHIHIPFHY